VSQAPAKEWDKRKKVLDPVRGRPNLESGEVRKKEGDEKGKNRGKI